MARITQRALLETLSRTRLLEIAEVWDVEVKRSAPKEALVDVLARKRTIPVPDLLDEMGRDELKAICRTFGLDDGGRAKREMAERILAAMGLSREATEPQAGGPDDAGAQAYTHNVTAKQRPEVGVQADFDPGRRGPRTYRYDSSIAPQLVWDENPARDQAEWLLALIARASQEGEAAMFAEPQVWRGSGEPFRSIADCVARLQTLTRPFLDWSGKAERRALQVPTLPLFVRERHSTQAILRTLDSHRRAGQTLDLFGDPKLGAAATLEAYEHDGPWVNRMILGDSLQVMNSLLEYEGLGGQVQMIYIDPPYGVKFGSNFQPFVRRRDVAHGKDEDMSREPEMVKAYRDTWELGLHSYLAYLRDRLLLAKELLTENGSVFVQISDENLHHVREVMDEVFGAENFCGLVTFAKTTSATSELLSSTNDYLLWFAKKREQVKYQRLYLDKELGGLGASAYNRVELADGSRRAMTAIEQGHLDTLPLGSKVFTLSDLTSQRPPGNFPVEIQGRVFRPRKGYWKTGETGMERLKVAGRLDVAGGTLRYVRYFQDFPVFQLSNLWEDTGVAGFTSDKLYVVQTSTKVVQRCLLMTTSPGDLVLDPTCGSGTTAYVAEQWGRRWITIDTSRVPLALARQRLLTATFPWYELADRKQGPGGGFIYQRKQNRKGEEVGGLVPRITLKSIANDEPPELVTLVDRPEVNDKITRVAGPFAVEATIAAARMVEEAGAAGEEGAAYDTPRAWIDRMIETLRSARQLRLPGNRTVSLERVRPLDGMERLHAEAELAPSPPSLQDGGELPHPSPLPGGEGGIEAPSARAHLRVAVAFGPRDAAVDQNLVLEAHREAFSTGYDQLFIFGFAIEAGARQYVDRLKLPTTYVAVTPDVVMSDLLKTNRASEIFSVTGLPDIAVERAGKRADGMPLYKVALRGLDVFFPDKREDEGAVESVPGDAVPCWMLDTDYNGLCFHAAQVFFPKTAAWDNLRRALKADFEESVWQHLAGTESEPFTAGDQRRIAVKVIDERGNELMVVKKLPQ